MKKTVLSLVLLIISSVSLASSLAEYSNVKPLLLQPLENLDGKTEGEIVGLMADRIQAITKSSEPVTVTVNIIKYYKQIGCSRVNIRLEQANVMTQQGTPATFEMDSGITLCNNGNPPLAGAK